MKKLATIFLVIAMTLTFAVGCGKTPNNQNANNNNANRTNNSINNDQNKTPGKINILLETDTEIYSVNVKYKGGNKTFKNDDMSAYKRGDKPSFERDRQYLGDMTIEIMDKDGNIIATKNFTGDYTNKNNVTMNYRVVDNNGTLDIVMD